MTEDLCIHELAPDTCSLCKPKRWPRPQPPSRFRGVTSLHKKAEFEGRCPECEEDILIGDDIRQNQAQQWCHYGCV